MQGLIIKLMIILLCISYELRANEHFTGKDSVEAHEQWFDHFHQSLLRHSNPWVHAYGLYMLSYDVDEMSEDDWRRYEQSLKVALARPIKDEASLYLLIQACEQTVVKVHCDRSVLLEELAHNYGDNMLAWMPVFQETLANNHSAEAASLIKSMSEATHAKVHIHYPNTFIEALRDHAKSNPMSEQSLEFEMNWMIGNKALSEEEVIRMSNQMHEYMIMLDLMVFPGGMPVPNLRQLVDFCASNHELIKDCLLLADVLIDSHVDSLLVMNGINIKRSLAESVGDFDQHKNFEAAKQSFYQFFTCLTGITYPINFYRIDLNLAFDKDRVMFELGEIPGLIHYAQALHRANPDERSHPEVCLAELKDNSLVSADRYMQYITD
jgi:hypothetical protein